MSEVAKRTRSSQKNQPSTSLVTPDEPNSKIDELVQSVRKIEADQTSFNKTLIENLNALETKVDTLVTTSESTQNEGNGRKRKRDGSEESAECSLKKKNDPAEQKKIALQEPIPAKSFVLTHNFQKSSGWQDGVKVHNVSPVEEHFGISWKIDMYRMDDHLALYVHCLRPKGKWCIEIKCKIELTDKFGKTMEKQFVTNYDGTSGRFRWGLPKILNWDHLIENYLLNDKFPVKMHIEITNMSGVYKDNLRCFDQTEEECSDIILVVKDQQFYLSKLYLASQSPYFKGMFLGQFREANQAKVVLKGIDPDDFQNYLEALYGEHAINESTTEGILLVADMFVTPMITRKCEAFLMKKSKKSNKTKLELSVRYRLEQLQKECLDNIKTMEDIRSIAPSNIREMDHSLTAFLLEKALSFN